MKKTLAIVGYNVVHIENSGVMTPINTVVYKDLPAVQAAANDGSLPEPEGMAGFVILPVYRIVDAKVETPKATEPKATATAPKAKAVEKPATPPVAKTPPTPPTAN